MVTWEKEEGKEEEKEEEEKKEEEEVHAWVSDVVHAWVSDVVHAWVSDVVHAWVSDVVHAWVSDGGRDANRLLIGVVEVDLDHHFKLPPPRLSHLIGRLSDDCRIICASL